MPKHNCPDCLCDEKLVYIHTHDGCNSDSDVKNYFRSWGIVTRPFDLDLYLRLDDEVKMKKLFRDALKRDGDIILIQHAGIHYGVYWKFDEEKGWAVGVNCLNLERARQAILEHRAGIKIHD